MAARRPGRLWLEFPLFGLDWQVRYLPTKHKLLDGGKTAGICFYEERVIYIDAGLSGEQQRVTLAHEIQHAIEDHAGVEHESAAPEDVADRWTDQMALGWMYVLRHCPNVVDVLRGVGE